MVEDKKQILQSTRTIAVVGLSASKTRAGYTVPKYMQSVGYRIIPVNPELDESLGEKAYPDLRSVPEPIDMVLIFRRNEHIPPIVDEAIEVGAKSVWMQL
ncbi:MAG: CoA-binding protein, partial [Anaerolineae bacterium]|nr:CoA-binding protein [Anaerolineae bacterium]